MRANTFVGAHATANCIHIQIELITEASHLIDIAQTQCEQAGNGVLHKLGFAAGHLLDSALTQMKRTQECN